MHMLCKLSITQLCQVGASLQCLIKEGQENDSFERLFFALHIIVYACVQKECFDN